MEVMDVSDFFTALPALETPRLILRALRLDDAEDHFAYASDPAVAEPGMWDVVATPEENRRVLAETLERYAAGQPTVWGIEHRADKRLIGSCGFVHYRPAHHNAAIGYALSRAYWGRGLMSEAVQAVIACGFATLHLHRIEATCLADNAGSIRILTKAGFRYEGTARDAYYLRGSYRDLCHYALLDAEGKRVAGHGNFPGRGPVWPS